MLYPAELRRRGLREHPAEGGLRRPRTILPVPVSPVCIGIRNADRSVTKVWGVFGCTVPTLSTWVSDWRTTRVRDWTRSSVRSPDMTMESMCTSCGAAVTGMRFCTGCGTPVRSAHQPPSQGAPEPVAPPRLPQRGADPEQGGLSLPRRGQGSAAPAPEADTEPAPLPLEQVRRTPGASMAPQLSMSAPSGEQPAFGGGMAPPPAGSPIFRSRRSPTRTNLSMCARLVVNSVCATCLRVAFARPEIVFALQRS